MSKGKRFCGRALDEWFLRRPIPWRDAPSLILSLHVGEPEGDAGELQNEVAYRGYRPIELPRDEATWKRNGRVVTNVGEIRFPTCDEFETRRFRVTHWALRPASEREVFRSGALPVPIEIAARVRVTIDPETMVIEES